MRALSETPILITTAVRAQASRTALEDESERLKLTLTGVEKWISLFPESPIVVCDGSGVDLSAYVRGMAPYRSDVEIMTLMNSRDMLTERGKGWGEGNILKYALQTSRILMDCDRFAKCTGKLWATNHRQFCRQRDQLMYFDYYGRLRPARLDTRYYISRRDTFFQLLIDAYHKVDERVHLDLETVYTRILLEQPAKTYISRVVPLVNGVSGSMGIRYKPSLIKGRFKGIRNVVYSLLG